MNTRHLLSAHPPNPAFEGTRGYALALLRLDRPPAPLNSGVGHVKSQARAGFAKRQDHRVRLLYI